MSFQPSINKAKKILAKSYFLSEIQYIDSEILVFKVIEIRFHGMGGQGAVMGALILAEAAFSEGKYAQKIPVYGGMRRGGDVTVFLRLDDKPIRRTCGIYEPDALVILDPALATYPAVRKGLKGGGLAVLNEEIDPSEVNLGVSLDKIATVDATGISMKVFGARAIPITNTIMLGAFAKTTDYVRILTSGSLGTVPPA